MKCKASECNGVFFFLVAIAHLASCPVLMCIHSTLPKDKRLFSHTLFSLYNTNSYSYCVLSYHMTS